MSKEQRGELIDKYGAGESCRPLPLLFTNTVG